jgi:hypothetical protein
MYNKVVAAAGSEPRARQLFCEAASLIKKSEKTRGNF